MPKIPNYFTRDEMSCNCGCGLIIYRQDFYDRLNMARHNAEVPFVINSWCRCPDHNQAVGGVLNSLHLTGNACDIECRISSARYKIVECLIMEGFNRIRIYPTFIHAAHYPGPVIPILTIEP